MIAHLRNAGTLALRTTILFMLVNYAITHDLTTMETFGFALGVGALLGFAIAVLEEFQSARRRGAQKRGES